KFLQVGSRSGRTGAEAAGYILDKAGIGDVRIEVAEGMFTDHYDPSKKVLRLSPQIYSGRSVTAIGVAAHEAGHAIQHKQKYAPLVLRQTLAPAAMFGSNLAWILMMIGFVIQSFQWIVIGIAAFSLAVLFTLVTLPVEFNASSRAKEMVASLGLVTGTEAQGVEKVLSAAAMTYVAAAVTAVMQLLYFLYRAGLLGGRRD
ncbi:MAG: zinc metallopeptidase, partial [Deltaproteobacteria bacterium]|nr:zinc metallopeptidase [Deltaproteobacteria bacterium]